MKSWIDIVRDANYFNLLVANQKRKLREEAAGTVEVVMPCRKDNITAKYDDIYYVDTICADFDGIPPTFISSADAHAYAASGSTEEIVVPHAEDPAAAQRAGNLGLFWGQSYSRSWSSVPTLHVHRDDGFPAVISMVNISKHYDQGVLHRKRKLPAISADYIGALWYQEPGEHVRRNGPACVLLENYKEYWEEGEFKGHRWSNYNLSWGWRDKRNDDEALEKFLGNLQGGTDMFSNSFFTDIQDEVCFITDFA